MLERLRDLMKRNNQTPESLYESLRPEEEMLREAMATMHCFFGDIHRAFLAIDKDRSNSVSETEFLTGLRIAKVPLSETRIRVLFHYLDTDRSGEISYAEFCRRFSWKSLDEAEAWMGARRSDYVIDKDTAAAAR